MPSSVTCSSRTGTPLLPGWLACALQIWLPALLFLLIAWGPVHAQTSAAPMAPSSLAATTIRTQHWIDLSGQIDLAGAQAAFAQGLFRAPAASARTLESSQAHWLRIEVDRAVAHGDQVLALHSTAIDDVQFYGPFDAQGRALAAPVRTGLVEPYASRPLGIERPVMRLLLPEPGRYEVYMRLQSRSSQSLQVSAWDTVDYVQSRQHKRLFDGMVYGILIALLTYNLVLAYVFRNASYGLYVLTCAAALFTLGSYNGHAAHYVLGPWPWWQQRSNMLGAALWIVFATLLCRSFLEVPKRLPRIHYVLLSVAAVAALGAVLALLGQTAVAQQIVEIAAVTGALLAFGIAAWVWRAGFAPAGWYLAGQALLFASVLGVVGVNWGLLHAPFLLANGLQIGVVAEMMVFAYALSARVRMMRQRQAELSQRADHFAEAAATDSLTGLANRLGLSQRAQQWQTEQRRPAVLLLDLDRFKPVNDTYGHEMGDRLLVEIAQRLQHQAREGDLVARLGGDEFVVMLPASTPAQLMALAQRLGEAVRAPFITDGPTIAVGASIGIAHAPEHGQTLTELLRHADAAMYRAKQRGTGHALYDSALDAR